MWAVESKGEQKGDLESSVLLNLHSVRTKPLTPQDLGELQSAGWSEITLEMK